MRKIKCKLYNEPDYSLTAQQQILYNRGIPVEKQEEWLNAGWDNINDWRLLKNADQAAKVIYDISTKPDKCVGILVDADPDGASGASLAYNFLHRIGALCEKELIFHETKVHGLSDLDLDEIKYEYDLLWIPDAASNDYADLEYLSVYLPVVITDHHEADYESPYAYVVNNQLCDYPNKQFSGAGVTWQVCRAVEDLYYNGNHSVSTSLLDLCACGVISDMMDSRELETKAVANLGITNLENKFLKNMAEAHKYSIDKMNGLNYLSWAFYITPYINCCFRSGTQEELEFVVKALLDDYCCQKVPSSKRGHKGEEVYWWEEAITIAERVKRRQTQLQNEAMDFLEKQIEEEHLTDNAIILCKCGPDDIAPSIVGLAANKIQAQYQHPALVLREVEEDGVKKLKGSGRNYSNCEIEDMRQVCEDTGLIDYAQGHGGAFGSMMDASNEQAFIETTNEVYKDISFTPVYWIDYSWTPGTVDSKRIIDIANLNIYGQNVPESFVEIHDIALHPSMIQLMGKNKDTIKITLPNGVAIMLFRQSEDLYNQMCEDNMVLDVCGKCNENIYNGISTPQVMMESYELREEWIF